MAEHFAPGVKKVEEDRYDRYIGAADALIAAGLVELHQLPGQPGNGAFMASFLPDGTRVRKGSTAGNMPGGIRVRRCGKKFEVAVVVDDQVWEERHAKWLAAHEREVAYKEARKHAESELASMPCTAEAYRARRIQALNDTLEFFAMTLDPQERHGYSFDYDSAREFRAIALRLHGVLKDGRVIFDQRRHDARIAEINAEVDKFAPACAKQITARPQLRLVQSHSESSLTA